MNNEKIYQVHKGNTAKIASILAYIKQFPVFKDINLLGYNKVFIDCSYVYLSNGFDEYFKEYCLTIQDRGACFINAIQSTRCTPYTMIWPDFNDNSILSLLHRYGISNGISILFRVDDGVETISIAGDKSCHNLQSQLINNSKVLNEFLCYFRQKVAEITESVALKDRGVYEKRFDTNSSEFNIAKEAYFNYDRKLSLREIECLRLLSQGFTIKDAAKSLSLSPRTVESYLNNVKIKFGVHFKSEAIKKYYSDTVKEIFDWSIKPPCF